MCFATIYQNGDFTGWNADFPAGDYESTAFFAQGGQEGSNSLKVKGPDNCCVGVYQEEIMLDGKLFLGQVNTNSLPSELLEPSRMENLSEYQTPVAITFIIR